VAPGVTDQEAFELVLAREFSDPECFAVHQLTVAAYRAEHPEGAGEHALAVLDAALRAAVHDGLDGPALRAFVRRTAARLRADPPPPRRRPARTGPSGIHAVAGARSAQEHCALVRAWAAQVVRAADGGG
jgi:hypothetical protein